MPADLRTLLTRLGAMVEASKSPAPWSAARDARFDLVPIVAEDGQAVCLAWPSDAAAIATLRNVAPELLAVVATASALGADYVSSEGRMFCSGCLWDSDNPQPRGPYGQAECHCCANRLALAALEAKLAETLQ